ncbi:hypothetical protein BDV18DRAFT_133369 [Aspergillus unguis]
MKASVIAALALAASTMASPVALQARGHAGEHCTCEVETVTVTVPAPTEVPPTNTPCPEHEAPTETAPAPGNEETWTQPVETQTWTQTWTKTWTHSESWTKPTETITWTHTESWTKPTVTETSTHTESSVEPTEPTDSWTNTATETIPTVTGTATETNTVTETNTNTATNTVTQTSTATVPTPTPTGCKDGKCHGTGHLVQDLGPQVDRLLTVTGTDGQKTLIQVNESVYNLLSGRVSLGDSVGEIIGDAASLGDLVKDLGPIIDCILTIVGEDSKILLVQLAPEIADLLRGAGVTLGLDSVNNPIGNLLKPVAGLLNSLGLNLKRDGNSNPFKVHGLDGKDQDVFINGPLGDELHGHGVAGIVGTVIRISISVTELVKDLGPEVDDLLVTVGRETGYLLIRLDPAVAKLVNTLLPELGGPLGSIVKTVGQNL